MTADSPGWFQVAGLILAAGSGSRMGKLKQLIPYGGGTLLWHAVDTALDAALGPVVVVIGAEAEAVRQALTHKDVLIAENPLWETGMGSSVAAGVRALHEGGEELDAVAILLTDQPKITARHLSQMRGALQKSDADAVAASYADTLGVPAMFRASVFDRLANLDPASGAKKLLMDSGLKVVPFNLPEAAFDLDTPADLATLT
jgi:molybdenum cofactor cytidylyltransferase